MAAFSATMLSSLRGAEIENTSFTRRGSCSRSAVLRSRVRMTLLGSQTYVVDIWVLSRTGMLQRNECPTVRSGQCLACDCRSMVGSGPEVKRIACDSNLERTVLRIPASAEAVFPLLTEPQICNLHFHTNLCCNCRVTTTHGASTFTTASDCRAPRVSMSENGSR